MRLSVLLALAVSGTAWAVPTEVSHQGRLFDAACIDLRHPLLADRPLAFVLDTALLSGTGETVQEVYVGGRRSVVSDQMGRGAARGSSRTAAPPERRG